MTGGDKRGPKDQQWGGVLGDGAASSTSISYRDVGSAVIQLLQRFLACDRRQLAFHGISKALVIRTFNNKVRQ